MDSFLIWVLGFLLGLITSLGTYLFITKPKIKEDRKKAEEENSKNIAEISKMRVANKELRESNKQFKKEYREVSKENRILRNEFDILNNLLNKKYMEEAEEFQEKQTKVPRIENALVPRETNTFPIKRMLISFYRNN